MLGPTWIKAQFENLCSETSRPNVKFQTFANPNLDQNYVYYLLAYLWNKVVLTFQIIG